MGRQLNQALALAQDATDSSRKAVAVANRSLELANKFKARLADKETDRLEWKRLFKEVLDSLVEANDLIDVLKAETAALRNKLKDAK